MFCITAVFANYVPAHAAVDPTGKTVTAVTITGNSIVQQSDILAVTKIKPGDKLAADKVKQDMQAIYDMGFFFDVVANFAEVPEGIKVIFTVMENPVLKDIVFKGNTKVGTDKLNSMMTVQRGKILDTATLTKNARAIEQYYHDQGYILARVSDTAMGNGGVLTITVNEGVLEGIVIKGNEKTKTNVITREMKLKVGEAFNAKDARRSMQKVYNLGFFEDVNMKLNPGRNPNAIVLETSVVEQKTGTFSIGGGYSEADGLIGIIEVGDNNFRGTGDKIKVHWEFGGKASNNNYEFGYTRPWLDSKKTSLGFSIYDMTNEYTDYEKGDELSTYDRERRGWEITLGRPQNDYLNNYVTFKHRTDAYKGHVSGDDYTVDDPLNATDRGPAWLASNFGTTNSITLMRVFDSRDNVFNPTDGSRFSLSAEFAGRAFGGDFNFNKFTAEGRTYNKVGRDHVLAYRLGLGYADGNMPDSQLFEVGGIDTLRGYHDDEFKGDKMITASAEYRFPIVKKVQGAVFTDVGKAWNGEGYDLGDLEASVGVGIRITTPIGPVRIDYAQGNDGGKTHFGFGGAF